MKICVLQSSYEGSGSVFEAVDSMPNPGLYVDKSFHDFQMRYVRKFAEKADIDAICEEDFDMYMNFMWGQLNDNVSGVEATRYLESKGVPVLLSPSDFIAKNKEDFRRAAKSAETYKVPGNSAGNFPKIVKYVDGLASIGMSYDSVCYSDEEVAQRIKVAKQREPAREVMVQDFIRGIESTAVVVEMGGEVYSLAPVDWVFDSETPIDEAWLTYSNKFEGLGEGKIHLRFVEDEPRRSMICDSAVAAFKALGMQGKGAWGRIDVRCESQSGGVYALEMNHMPALFYSPDDKLSDDIIIRESFPGGHEAFIEMLIYTKQFQLKQAKLGLVLKNNETASRKAGDSNGHAKDRIEISSKIRRNGYATQSTERIGAKEPIGEWKAMGLTIAEVYDSCAENYDSVSAKQAFRTWQLEYFAKHDYCGTVLDLACGTGGIGMIIRQTCPDARISGIDLSARSLKRPYVLEHYTQPIKGGYIQEEIMLAPEKAYDHVICFGALHFLSRTEFMACVARMFMVARKSVAFDVDDVSRDYIDAIVEVFGEGLRNYNNVEAMRRFGTPPGWKVVVDEEMELFYSPTVLTEVRGRVLRFERI